MMTDEELDRFLLANRFGTLPKYSDASGWLVASQRVLHNVRALIVYGQSETAEAVLAHYWRRWREAGEAS